MKLMPNFIEIPIPEVKETLNIDYIRGRNGQIYVVSLENYNAWKRAKTKRPQPPKIQFYLDQAASWMTKLEENPELTHTQLGMEFALSRSEVIHTLNLLKLPNQAKEFIQKIPPSITPCPLTKKKLRTLCSVPEKEVQLEQFKNLALNLFKNNQEVIKLLNEILSQPNQPIENRNDIPIVQTQLSENSPQSDLVSQESKETRFTPPI
jgi:hypothetical protein